MNEILKIDTKGICLLCMCVSEDDSFSLQPPTTFKMLLRYLKIDVMKLDHFSSSLNSSGSDSLDITVTLCHRCSAVATQFLQLFQEFEKIRMELDNCAGKLRQAIEGGMKDTSRVLEYRHRMRSDDSNHISVLDALNASIAETIRKKTLKKCVQRLNSSSPRILIKTPTIIKDVIPKHVGFVKSENADTKEKQSIYPCHSPSSPFVDDSPISQLQNDPLRATSTSVNRSFNKADDKSKSPTGHDPPALDKCVKCKCKVNAAKISVIAKHQEARQPIKCNSIKLPNGTFKCAKCGKIFRTATIFQKHYLQTHRRQSALKCVYCSKVYPRQRSLTCHILTALTLLKLSNRLPPNTSEEELKDAVKLLFDDDKKVAKKSSTHTSYTFYACPLPDCERKCRNGFHIRAHLFQSHLNEVKAAIEKMRTDKHKDHSSERHESRIIGKEIMMLPSENPEKIKLELGQYNILQIEEEMNVDDQSFIREPSSDPLELDTTSHVATTGTQSQLAESETEIVDLHTSRRGEIEESQEPTETWSKIPWQRQLTILKGGRCQCLHCGKICTGKKTFRVHYNELHRKFKCEYCNKTFGSDSSLKAHITIQHTLQIFPNRFPSGTTDDELREAVILLLAQRKNPPASGSFPSECPICEQKCNLDFLVKVHLLETHLDEVVLMVERLREERCTLRGGRINRTIVTTGLKEPQVNGKNRKKSASSSSTSKNKNTKGHKCSLCEDTFFLTTSLLVEHRQEFHGIGKMKMSFQCAHCEKIFPRQPLLQLHQEVEHGFQVFSKRLPPGTTEDEFTTVVIQLLSQVRKKRDGEGAGRIYECQICNKCIPHSIYKGRAHIMESHLDQIICKLELEKGTAELRNCS